MGVVRMENIKWRFQLVMSEYRNETEFSLYEVGVDTATNSVAYVSDVDPVRITGSTVDEIISLLYNAIEDIKTYGVLTNVKLDEAIATTEIEPAYEDDYDSAPIRMDDYSEDDYVDMMDQEYDDKGKVLDILHFMERNK